jgi:2'-5' RNA ligase
MRLTDRQLESSTARVFFALPCNALVAEQLDSQVRDMERSLTFRIHHPPPLSHHITLCFAPKLPTALLTHFWNDVSKFPAVGPIAFTLGAVEALTSRRLCRLFLRRIQFEAERVRAVQDHIKAALQHACGEAELPFPHEYHITVATVCGSVPASACRSFLSSYVGKDDQIRPLSGAFERLCMIQSVLTSTGPDYKVLHERELGEN